jgi:hypothetical protein
VNISGIGVDDTIYRQDRYCLASWSRLVQMLDKMMNTFVNMTNGTHLGHEADEYVFVILTNLRVLV